MSESSAYSARGAHRTTVSYLLLGMLVLWCSNASAQSLTSAGLDGRVLDAARRPVAGAIVSAIDTRTRATHRVPVSRVGRFRIALLPPGIYDLNVESIGYRPARVVGVAVVAGQDASVDIVLTRMVPPVDGVDTVQYSGAGMWAAGGRTDVSATGGLPDRARYAESLSRLSSSDIPGHAVEGLPHAATTMAIDGVPFVPARHPGFRGASAGSVLPALMLDRARWLGNGADVEWSGGHAGILSVDSRRGPNRFTAQAFGDWSGGQLTTSKYYDPPSTSTQRGAFLLGGPVIRDTASFMIGVEYQREERGFPAIAAGDSAAASFLAVARDSFGRDLEEYRRPVRNGRTAMGGFGRFDWQFGATNLLTARAGFGTVNEDSPDLDPLLFPSPGSKAKASDFHGSVALLTALGRRASQELRVSAERSRREYTADPLAATLGVESFLPLAADPGLAGTVRRSGARLSEVLHFGAGTHTLKVGGVGAIAGYDYAVGDYRSGLYHFANARQFALLRGSYAQATGLQPVAQFSLLQVSGFLQDAWRPVPGMSLLLGLRLDYERRPVDDIAPNDSLLSATGLDNVDLSKGRPSLSPRLGLTWDPTGRGAWVLRGEAGLYPGTLDPGLMAELIANDGRTRVRRGTGNVDSWPAAPDPAVIPLGGVAISTPGPSLEPPRSGKVSVGVTRAIGRPGAFHLSGTYRHTDFITRRHDLNRVAAPVAADARGRPLYGSLQQFGSQVVPDGGLARRFSGFDRIWALDADGSSDYYAVTATLEHRSANGFEMSASYTYSRTEDNWIGARSAPPDAALTPFPERTGTEDWARGRSDYDTPHVVAAGLTVPLIRAFRIGVLYRFQSGRPFTPGFRYGVDMNGDGSGANDPAFVDEAIAGTSDLYTAWECLRGQAGAFAERNSCREPSIHMLDARVTVTPVRTSSVTVDIVLDALNLLEPDVAVRDHALYLVNGQQAIATNTATGVVTVPLLINRHFGEPLVRRTNGRQLRIGVRVGQ